MERFSGSLEDLEGSGADMDCLSFKREARKSSLQRFSLRIRYISGGSDEVSTTMTVLDLGGSLLTPFVELRLQR